MILKGNQRANGTELAIHLMKDENEHVEIAELRGFAADDLMGAFQEVQAISRATKCKKYLYSLSLNPPASGEASRKDFEAAVERAEKTLGLSGQPRAVIFHTKEGRTHCHAVWSRLDIETMKAIKLNYPKRKLNDLSRDLFHEHGWEVPAGYTPGHEADLMNYTYTEYQEAKRGNREAKHFKALIKRSWEASDNRQSFEAALERSGLFLAQGDRRGFVAVDYDGKIYSLSRWTGVKSKELTERLGEPEHVRTIQDTQNDIAERMTPKLENYVSKVKEAAISELREFKAQSAEMTERQREQREDLKAAQDERWQTETAERASRFAGGLKGLWHRITGKHARIAQENELEAQRCLGRDQNEFEQLTDRQQRYRQQLQRHIETARASYNKQLDALYTQLFNYAAMRQEADAVQDRKPREQTVIDEPDWNFEQ